MYTHLIHATVAMLAIVNPIAASPLFATITTGMSRKEKRKSAYLASIAVLVILGGAVLVGTRVLQIFGVGLDAFRFGGGLIILLMGLDMLRGETSAVHDDSKNDSEQDDDQEDRVLVPFAMPLVAGPGSITTAITLSAASPGWDGILVTLGAVVLTVITLRFSLSFSSQIADRLGGRPLRLLTRFMGLILVAIGAQFLLAGFSGFLSSSIPNLAPHTELAQP